MRQVRCDLFVEVQTEGEAETSVTPITDICYPAFFFRFIPLSLPLPLAFYLLGLLPMGCLQYKELHIPQMECSLPHNSVFRSPWYSLLLSTLISSYPVFIIPTSRNVGEGGKQLATYF